ncbi:hypothetical protein [Pseudaestuariivita atlantica]|uniref:Saccharopine dehydrogenase NADP binding domain-containing protein n=1 Tax=Pseudaestuariivita atlantica TaxID=1317121 RepID=A0A0L1JS51_9RHOB|nr:hypothetical protein [Pseudaestuariivita atlantica]KNG94575.1 hypothetical protein ATO11_03980 [Pseudaestuariivita atlantica]
MARRVWLLGGSGKVGGHVARMLAADGIAVTTVSRRRHNPGSPHPHVSLDLAAPGTALPLGADDVAINLTEATTTDHVLAILRQGATLLETSATEEYVLPTRDAVRAARPPGTLVDCVGVAPGLTNLMAHELVRTHPGIRHLHIGGELGLGEHAGAAATRWFLDGLGARTAAKVNGTWQEVPTGSFSRKFAFHPDRPARRAIAYPFVEQTLLAEDFNSGIDTVLTYLALSPPWITRLLSAGLRLGAGPVASRRAESLTRFLMRFPPLGETSTRIVVEGEDHAGNRASITLETGEQSRATAAIIAATARAVDPMRPAGLTTIVDWLTVDDAVAALKDAHPRTRLARTAVDRTETAIPGKIPNGVTP